MTKTNKILLPESIEGLVGLGLSKKEAILQAQAAMDGFNDRNNALLERIDAQSNETGRSAITQQVTLATLLITVTGIFISQQDIYKNLSSDHKKLLLAVFSFLLISIVVGIVNYFKDLIFYQTWRRGIESANKTIEAGVIGGGLSSITKVYNKHAAILSKLPKSSGRTFLVAQFILLAFGMLGFIALLISVMFRYS